MMKRCFFCAALLFVVSFWSGAGANAAEGVSPQLVRHVKNSTVMVYVEYGDRETLWGTGFVVGPGLVVTNAHVVNEQSPKRIYVSNDILPRTSAQVVTLRYDNNEYTPDRSRQRNYDIAILSFQPQAGAVVSALPFARGAVPSESVIAAGYPGEAVARNDYAARVRSSAAYGNAPAFAAPLVVTAGSVMSVAEGEPQLVIHNARCSPGNSGGPVVNARGEVVGMQTWTTLPDDPKEYMSLAIGARDITAFLERNGFSLLR